MSSFSFIDPKEEPLCAKCHQRWDPDQGAMYCKECKKAYCKDCQNHKKAAPRCVSGCTFFGKPELGEIPAELLSTLHAANIKCTMPSTPECGWEGTWREYDEHHHHGHVVAKQQEQTSQSLTLGNVQGIAGASSAVSVDGLTVDGGSTSQSLAMVNNPSFVSANSYRAPTVTPPADLIPTSGGNYRPRAHAMQTTTTEVSVGAQNVSANASLISNPTLVGKSSNPSTTCVHGLCGSCGSSTSTAVPSLRDIHTQQATPHLNFRARDDADTDNSDVFGSSCSDLSDEEEDAHDVEEGQHWDALSDYQLFEPSPPGSQRETNLLHDRLQSTMLKYHETVHGEIQVLLGGLHTQSYPNPDNIPAHCVIHNVTLLGEISPEEEGQRGWRRFVEVTLTGRLHPSEVVLNEPKELKLRIYTLNFVWNFSPTVHDFFYRAIASRTSKPQGCSLTSIQLHAYMREIVHLVSRPTFMDGPHLKGNRFVHYLDYRHVRNLLPQGRLREGLFGPELHRLLGVAEIGMNDVVVIPVSTLPAPSANPAATTAGGERDQAEHSPPPVVGHAVTLYYQPCDDQCIIYFHDSDVTGTVMPLEFTLKAEFASQGITLLQSGRELELYQNGKLSLENGCALCVVNVTLDFVFGPTTGDIPIWYFPAELAALSLNAGEFAEYLTPILGWAMTPLKVTSDFDISEGHDPMAIGGSQGETFTTLVKEYSRRFTEAHREFTCVRDTSLFDELNERFVADDLPAPEPTEQGPVGMDPRMNVEPSRASPDPPLHKKCRSCGLRVPSSLWLIHQQLHGPEEIKLWVTLQNERRERKRKYQEAKQEQASVAERTEILTQPTARAPKKLSAPDHSRKQLSSTRCPRCLMFVPAMMVARHKTMCDPRDFHNFTLMHLQLLEEEGLPEKHGISVDDSGRVEDAENRDRPLSNVSEGTTNASFVTVPGWPISGNPDRLSTSPVGSLEKPGGRILAGSTVATPSPSPQKSPREPSSPKSKRSSRLRLSAQIGADPVGATTTQPTFVSQDL